ncbi:hypothetical protein GQ600_20328 [Phytophthora cactorum]|nr:hypothetical protein GQ600_20328 [Phytophthora cactorum]
MASTSNISLLFTIKRFSRTHLN